MRVRCNKRFGAVSEGFALEGEVIVKLYAVHTIYNLVGVAVT